MGASCSGFDFSLAVASSLTSGAAAGSALATGAVASELVGTVSDIANAHCGEQLRYVRRVKWFVARQGSQLSKQAMLVVAQQSCVNGVSNACRGACDGSNGGARGVARWNKGNGDEMRNSLSPIHPRSTMMWVREAENTGSSASWRAREAP